MVTGHGTHSSKIEIIDLANSTLFCDPWVDYPLDVYYATGQVVGNDVVVCGGKLHNSRGVVNDCYKLGPKSAEPWPNLSLARGESSTGVLNNSLMVVAGRSTGSFVKNVDFISENEQKDGPNLPTTAVYGCVITINENEVMHTGGDTP